MERYRIHPEAAIYFVTYSIVEWLPLFVAEATFRIVTDSLTFCHHNKHLRINAFVIMPTHMHMIVFDGGFDNERLIRTLTDFRKFTGRQLSDMVGRPCHNGIGHFPKCFTETLRAQATADRERRLWQPSRHPEAIQTEPFWRQKVDYLHDNPRRKGLVRLPQEWRWSSAARYYSDGQHEADVPLTAIAW
jgi:REP element-mobilizing transposase RayT